MTYELALQLKQAGFPQHRDLIYCLEDLKTKNLRDVVVMMAFNTGGRHVTFEYSCVPEPIPDDWSQGKGRFSFYFCKEYLNSEEGQRRTVYKPTLSELIEELAKMKVSFELRQTYSVYKDEVFYVIEIPGQDDMERCDTPEEAVANLYLALNKK